MIFSIVYFLKYFRHLDSAGEPELTLGGYYCPQCRAKYTELPVECKVCGMFSTCPCSSVCTLIFREHPCVQFSQSVSSLWNRSNFSFRSSPGPFLPSPLPPWGLPGDPTGEAWGREVSSTLTLWKPLCLITAYIIALICLFRFCEACQGELKDKSVGFPHFKSFAWEH